MLHIMQFCFNLHGFSVRCETMWSYEMTNSESWGKTIKGKKEKTKKHPPQRAANFLLRAFTIITLSQLWQRRISETLLWHRSLRCSKGCSGQTGAPTVWELMHGRYKIWKRQTEWRATQRKRTGALYPIHTYVPERKVTLIWPNFTSLLLADSHTWITRLQSSSSTWGEMGVLLIWPISVVCLELIAFFQHQWVRLAYSDVRNSSTGFWT